MAGSSSGGAGLASASGCSTSSSVFGRTLRSGEAGSDVTKLQTWMSDLDYSVYVTGYYDSVTKSAVRRFQRAHRLRPASGSVGKCTASTVRTAVRGLGHVSVDPQAYDPIPGFSIGRDDMGVDGGSRSGAPIYAPLASKLVQVMRDWYAGEPLLLYRFLNHPRGAMSNYWYVAEQVRPATTRIGTVFRARQRVASFASSGTGIEIGWGSPTSWSRTLAGMTDAGAANPPSGAKTRWGESFKTFFRIR
jgi:hypothetical protein